jgi:hypothetical protein
MTNNYLKYINRLGRELADNGFNSLEFVKYAEADISREIIDITSITVEVYGFARGIASRYGVQVIGDEHSVRLLGLILISRAMSSPVPAMLLRLETDSEVNLIYLEPIKAELNFYDCVPKLLEYRFCSETDEYSREGMVVKDIDRPSFGHLPKQDKVERLMRQIPEWVGDALSIDGTANSTLRLGAMLLDLTHPSRPGGGLMHLQRRFEQVCALTYSIDLELRLTD